MLLRLVDLPLAAKLDWLARREQLAVWAGGWPLAVALVALVATAVEDAEIETELEGFVDGDVAGVEVFRVELAGFFKLLLHPLPEPMASRPGLLWLFGGPNILGAALAG